MKGTYLILLPNIFLIRRYSEEACKGALDPQMMDSETVVAVGMVTLMRRTCI